MFSLISDHDLLAILSRGYVYSRFISLNVLLIVGVDVRPLTPGLGPSHQSWRNFFPNQVLTACKEGMSFSMSNMSSTYNTRKATWLPLTFL